jgi:hypothetical protein
MIDKVYSAEIAIQGDKVLRFIHSTNEVVIYEVIGFVSPTITIKDYRNQGIHALYSFIQSGDVASFLSEFCSPAQVTLNFHDDNNIIIELFASRNEQPEQMLWIAVGLRDSIPVYDYIFDIAQPFGEDSFAFASLFNIPMIRVDPHSAAFVSGEYNQNVYDR